MKTYFDSRGQASAEFVRIYAIERKFHTWFEFSQRMPDKLFKSFGMNVLNHYRSQLEVDEDFSKAASSFMTLISLRNTLIHGNLAEQQSEKTFAEVRDLYLEARQFPAMAFAIIEDCDAPQH